MAGYPSPRAAFKPEVTRILLEAPRKADRPLSIGDLTRLLMEQRGLAYDDLKLHKP
jgi:hypothetical protein